MLLRFLPDGNLDLDFNTVGYVTTDIRPYWDNINAIDMQTDGKIVCAGMTSGYSTSGNNDIAVTRYLNDYGIGITDLSTHVINLYPNPASQSISLDLSTINELNAKKIILFNSIGVLVETIEINADKLLTIDISEYTNGVYYLSIESNNKTIANKVFVVKN